MEKVENSFKTKVFWEIKMLLLFLLFHVQDYFEILKINYDNSMN